MEKKRIIKLKIKKMGINGEGIGYFQRKIVFVPQALPEEYVLARIEKEQPRYINAELVKILKKSPVRTQPRDKYDVGGIEL